MSGPSLSLDAWLQAQGVTRIAVVSPHLDDAAFSLASLLADRRLPPREVWTVFTQARPDSDATYTRATGFTDPVQEFAARRAEDRAAMTLLGVAHVHLGAQTDRFTPDVVQAIAARLAALASTERPVLVLLPAGAGGTIDGFERLKRRVLRRPAGCRPHAEHEWVRDGLRPPLSTAPGVLTGYYAEVPYQWADRREDILARLQALDAAPLAIQTVRSDIEIKLAVARAYRSQFEIEFGHREGFQRRCLAGDEWLFLPVRTAPRGPVIRTET